MTHPGPPWQLAGDQQLVSRQTVDHGEARHNNMHVAGDKEVQRGAVSGLQPDTEQP